MKERIRNDITTKQQQNWKSASRDICFCWNKHDQLHLQFIFRSFCCRFYFSRYWFRWSSLPPTHALYKNMKVKIGNKNKMLFFVFSNDRKTETNNYLFGQSYASSSLQTAQYWKSETKMFRFFISLIIIIIIFISFTVKMNRNSCKCNAVNKHYVILNKSENCKWIWFFFVFFVFVQFLFFFFLNYLICSVLLTISFTLSIDFKLIIDSNRNKSILFFFFLLLLPIHWFS